MMLKRFMAWLKRNPCAECIYYQPENNTCGSKKAVTMGPGYVSRMDRLFCEPNKEGNMDGIEQIDLFPELSRFQKWKNKLTAKIIKMLKRRR